MNFLSYIFGRFLPMNVLSDLFKEYTAELEAVNSRLDDQQRQLQNIEYLLTSLLNHEIEVLEEIRIMQAAIDALTEKVAEVESVEKSAVLLIEKLVEELKTNATDPAAIVALADRLEASKAALAAAVAAVPV